MNDKYEPIEPALQQLIEALKSSEVCRRYEAARAQIEADSDRRRQIDEFRKKAFLLQESHDFMNNHSRASQLFDERMQIRQDSAAAEYLSAELDVCRMLQYVCLQVMGVTDLQIEPFEEDIHT